uniref:Retrotransposon gag domain-containing protein n=1 Tax=Fagus sylvatica TaxID=28930 RepID=A0A2N9ETX9_FAGSY
MCRHVRPSVQASSIRVETAKRAARGSIAIMEGAPNDGTSADPTMTPIERQMGGEAEKTPQQSRHRAESAGSSAPPNRQKTAKTTRSSKQLEKPNRSSKQPERPDRSSKQPKQQDRQGHSSKQPDRSARSSRDPDDKTARLEKELREMRKQMGDMKNSLKVKAARNLDNLVHRIDSPFIPSIADFPLPSKFKVSLLENFDGTKDPFDYLEAFKTIMQLQAVPEEVMCRAFPLGLRGSATSTKGMIADPPAQRQANGGRITKGIPTKHMNAEDALEAMDDPPPKRRKDTEERKTEPAKQKVPKFTETPERKRNDRSPCEIQQLHTYEHTYRQAPPADTRRPFSSVARDHGHLTEDCVALKEQVETLIRQGKLQKYVSHPANTYPAKPSAQREHTKHNRPGPVGEIRTIVGGPASGGTSRASRKAYARQVHNIMVVQRPPKNVCLDDQIISFSEEDARGTHQPHDDALVITINIAGLTTRRVMVDNGSSANILYLPTYQQMRLDKDKLRPMDAPLVGFTGDKVCPIGIVTLPITVGTHPKTVSKTVCHNPIFTPGIFSSVGTQNEAARTKSGLIRRGLITSNNLQNEAYLGGNVCAKILSDPLQLGPRAKTFMQEGHFSYDMQLPDRQELLRSSRNLNQKMTPWHKEHSDGLCSQDHILRTQARLCARPVPLEKHIPCTTWNSRIAKNLPGLAGIPIGKMSLQTDQKHPGGLCSRGHISQVQARIPANPEPCKSRQRKLSDGTKNVENPTSGARSNNARELGQDLRKNALGVKRIFPPGQPPSRAESFLTRNKLIREPGCVGKITTPATTWNSRFAESIPRLTGIFAGKVHTKTAPAPRLPGAITLLVRTPIRANFIPLERGRRELSEDMLHDPF